MASNAALRSIYPVRSPAFLWKAESGCRSHSGGRVCEELKRANGSVLHVFRIPTSKMQYEWYDLLSSKPSLNSMCMWFRLFIETNILYLTLSLLECV